MEIEIAKRKYPDETQDHQPDTVEVWQMSEWPIVDQIKSGSVQRQQQQQRDDGMRWDVGDR